MKKENILLVLWIIFGYLFISAIDSILYFIIYLIYFALAKLEISYKILKIALPIITLALYGFTTLFLIKKVHVKSSISGIYLTKFPKKLTILLGVISFVLPLIVKNLFVLFTISMVNSKSYNLTEYVAFNQWFTVGFGISQLLVVVILLVSFFTKLEKLNNG